MITLCLAYAVSWLFFGGYLSRLTGNQRRLEERVAELETPEKTETPERQAA